MNFVKINAVNGTTDLEEYKNLHLYFSHACPILVKIWYKVSTHNAVEYSWLSAKLVQGRPHFTHKCVWQENLHAYQYPSQCLLLPRHLHSSHLANAWQHFIINVMAVMVITSMGVTSTGHSKKHNVTLSFSPLRINNSRNTVGQNQEFWMTEVVKQHFEEICLKGWFFSSRKKWVIHTGMIYIV